MKISPRIMFLIDGVGATVSASLMGLVIAQFVPIFGMPSSSAYVLAAIPILYIVYSFYHYFRLPKDWQVNLKLIAAANLLYCFISIGLVFYHFEELTKLGLAYFLIEIIVVLGVVVMELRFAKSCTH